MKGHLEKKTAIFSLTAFLIVVLYYLGVSFLYLSPLEDTLAAKERQLDSIQKLNVALEKRLAPKNEDDANIIAELQKQVPAEPMIEQLMLDFEKAEIVSNSLITSMEFDKGSTAGGGDQTAVREKEKEAKSASGPERQKDGQAGGSLWDVVMPEGISNSQVTIIVASESYFELEQFIETLESLDRAVVVDSISFKGPEEVAALSDSNESIEMTLTVNAFFLKEPEDQEGSTPKIQVPEPAGKRNPFPALSDLSEGSPAERERSFDEEEDE